MQAGVVGPEQGRLLLQSAPTCQGCRPTGKCNKTLRIKKPERYFYYSTCSKNLVDHGLG